MTLTWTKEASPRWDADKQRLFGPAELAAVGLRAPGPGEPASRGQLRRQVQTTPSGARPLAGM